MDTETYTVEKINFKPSKEIGNGSSGRIYKGKIDGGRVVALKI